MEELKFDLTTQDGLTSTQNQLKSLGKSNPKVVGATMTIDIEDMFKDLTNIISKFIDRFFDLFDDTKKLEKQMELAIKTIEISRAAGAKSIDIIINSKNKGKLETYLKKIDAKIGGKLEKDNSITYSIKF